MHSVALLCPYSITQANSTAVLPPLLFVRQALDRSSVSWPGLAISVKFVLLPVLQTHYQQSLSGTISILRTQ